MIIYTDHAEERVAGRGIQKAWVEEAIRKPSNLLDAKYGKKQAIKKINSEEISVIYAKEGDNVIVITVFWGR
ncbi:MAG: hypothetical protein A3J28_13075 [Acidobacteria bacterium RIFCSPLOWO2_12_FULL_60_22]|nr:MAG: hypothetical protein A3J28_13075 [Acidobacteria bacterium RIFCSPLOWO2_12_FULL_60_22]